MRWNLPGVSKLFTNKLLNIQTDTFEWKGVYITIKNSNIAKVLPVLKDTPPLFTDRIRPTPVEIR